MPIELFYGDKSHRVAPISADDERVSLEIDGQPTSVPLDAVAAAQPRLFEAPLPRDPSDAQLFALFLPAAENQFVAPRFRYEGDPNATQLIARDLGISVDELQQWQTLFENLSNASRKSQG